MRNQSGVTLMEVMSCMMILCVLGGIATPIIENTKSRIALRGEISNLVAELHRARSLAIKTNAFVAFCYTETGYKIFVDDGRGGGTKEDWIQQPGEQILANVALGERLKIVLDESSFTSQRTRFSRSPGLKPGAVVMQEYFGNKRKVIINVIGRVRVENF